jgi:hypothetical protein
LALSLQASTSDLLARYRQGEAHAARVAAQIAAAKGEFKVDVYTQAQAASVGAELKALNSAEGGATVSWSCARCWRG